MPSVCRHCAPQVSASDCRTIPRSPAKAGTHSSVRKRTGARIPWSRDVQLRRLRQEARAQRIRSKEGQQRLGARSMTFAYAPEPCRLPAPRTAGRLDWDRDVPLRSPLRRDSLRRCGVLAGLPSRSSPAGRAKAGEPHFRQLEPHRRLAAADRRAQSGGLVRVFSYSCRRATTGSTRAALAAGMQQATKAAAADRQRSRR